MELVKNKEIIVDIVDMGIEGEGVAKIDNYPIFIKNAIIGEKIKIKLVKVNKNFGFGKIVKIIEKSPYRVEPICKCFDKCGGCNLQHIEYSKQLEYKMNMVKNNFRKFKLDENKIIDIIGMEKPYYYRNKAQYPIGKDKSGNVITGFYANRTHNIVSNEICYIEHGLSEKIIKEIILLINKYNIEIYNEITQKGYLRSVVLKVSFTTNDIMVIFVTNEDKNILNDLINELIRNNVEIKTVVQNVNNVLYGNGYIKDYIGDYVFNISTLSFYQINPVQTQKLYNKVKEYIGEKCDILFDLYCGIGTIGIYCSDKTKKIYGIEIVDDAIKDAVENAKNNNVENAKYFVGEAENKIDELYNKGIEADVVIIDPPRKGIDNKLINTLIEKKPQKIVYVSCNNATLARDIQLLEDIYELKECTLFDMFPQTSHVECVALLSRREALKAM